MRRYDHSGGPGSGQVLPDPAGGLVQLLLHPLLLPPDVVHEQLIVAAAGSSATHGQTHLGLFHGTVSMPLWAAHVDVSQLPVSQCL